MISHDFRTILYGQKTHIAIAMRVSGATRALRAIRRLRVEATQFRG